MGDRCYMHVTCRREDQGFFAEIGFHLDYEQTPNAPVIEMIDEEANYAHNDKMPAHVPYFGYSGAGGNYGASSFACDGRRYREVETGYAGGFVVQWDEKKKRPTPESLRAISRYFPVRKKVEQKFTSLITPPRK